MEIIKTELCNIETDQHELKDSAMQRRQANTSKWMVVTKEPMRELADGRYRSSLPFPEKKTNTRNVVTSKTWLIAERQNNGTSFGRLRDSVGSHGVVKSTYF